MNSENFELISEIDILIVEDESIVAFDIKEILEEEGYRVQIALNPGQALILLNHQRPDLILLDINLDAEISGIDLAKYLSLNNKNIPFIYLTSYTDKKTMEEVKETFPLGYIAKPFHKAQLLSTIAVVLSNVNKSMFNSSLHLDKINARLTHKISEREWQIIQQIIDGKPNSQIGTLEYLSINTVKYHIKNIYDKLDVHSRAELISKISKIHMYPIKN